MCSRIRDARPVPAAELRVAAGSPFAQALLKSFEAPGIRGLEDDLRAVAASCVVLLLDGLSRASRRYLLQVR
jgi:hypothetical protein